MKRNSMTAIALTALMTALTFTSCLDDNDSSTDNSNRYANAVVTVRQSSDKMVLQLDNNTQLIATNIAKSPYGKEVRALANLSNVDTQNKTVYVNWIDSIVTKNTAKNYAAKNDSAYGNDPVEIVNSFETVAEDGYLTLRFRTYWAGKKAHQVNLVHRTDASSTPYMLDFMHNANGEHSGTVSDGIVAFRLPDSFNESNDSITITLRWKSFQKQTSGDSIKTATLKYLPRKN